MQQTSRKLMKYQVDCEKGDPLGIMQEIVIWQ